MNAVKINSKDFINPAQSVVESAGLIGNAVSKELREGANVVVTLDGVRGTSSSFFNVILAAVKEALDGQPAHGRFEIETDTQTQRMVFQRSFDAFFPPKR